MTRLAALAFAVQLAACQTPAQSAAAPELQLKSYKVPAASAPQLRAVIHGALFLEKDKSVGRVSVSPDGQLVVLGTPQIQAGVQQLITGWGERPPPPSLELTYWMIRGKPAAGQKPALPPELSEVQPALAAMPQPAMQYELVERMRLASIADERAQVQGRVIEISQQASMVGDKIVAELRFRPLTRASSRVETRVQLAPGQLLVLAEAGAPEQDGEYLYLVRAAVLGAR